MSKWIALGSAIGIMVISLAIFTELMAGVYPSLITALTSINNSGKSINASGYWLNGNYTTVPLRSLVSPDGVIPLVAIAVFVILVIVGLFAFVKGGKKR